MMVYSDIVNAGLILPEKESYTLRDFNALLDTHGAITARFIMLCSAIFWADHHGLKTYTRFLAEDVEKKLDVYAFGR